MNLIEEKLKILTTSPGCYLMKNKDNKIIYVGKAKNLKKRVSSYFNKEHTGKTKALVSNIANFEYIVTKSEVESLLLEINLIKKYSPKYNIMLKDNKSYPYIEITNDKYPRLVISRPRKKKKSSILFGPYPNAYAARKIVQLLNRLYPFRKCQNMPKKVCLYYHINECLGYCENKVSKDIVDNMIKEVTSFLKGDYTKVKEKINFLMNEASKNLNFEKAIEYKEMLSYIDTVLEKQKISLNDNMNRDVINYYVKNEYISICVIHIRNGMVLMRDKEIFPLIDDEKDILSYYLTCFYEKNEIPKEILISDKFDVEMIKKVVNSKVLVPVKGIKKKLLDMAYDNAKVVLEENFELIKRDEKRTYDANEQLASLLNIKDLKRIEIFDNAHLFGTYNVSGMVVFVNGVPDKNEYRKYKISSDIKDDYSMMKEVIYRRYYKVLSEKLEKPDLIIVDGSTIQISAAKEILSSLFLDIPVIGLKKNDKHSTTGLIKDDKEINIDKTSDLFHLLTRMQDEVHRYTINYHKQIRGKGLLSSKLDNINKIGEKRKQMLLKKYKTINRIKELSLKELEKDLPKDAALSLYNYLKNNE